MNIHLLDQHHIYNFQVKEGETPYYVVIHTNKLGDFTLWEVINQHGEKIYGPKESEIVNQVKLDWKKLVS